jgi:hypothetical protein
MLRADDDLIDLIAQRVEQRLTRSNRATSQHGSPLGARKHRAVVRRRVERNEGGAHIVGRRYLLTPDALQEELARETTKNVEERRARKLRKAHDPELDQLQRELVGGLRRLQEVR